MDLLIETKTVINGIDKYLKHKNNIFFIYIKKILFTKEYLDYCYVNNIFNIMDLLEFSSKKISPIVVKTKNPFLMLHDPLIYNNFDYNEPIISEDYIIYSIEFYEFYYTYNIIENFIKDFREINGNKKFVLIYIYCDYNYKTINEEIIKFIEPFIKILSYTIPFIYITIMFRGKCIGYPKFNLFIKNKYNNYIYVCSIFSKNDDYLRIKENTNFILKINRGNYRKETFYNELLYYFIMYTI